MPKSKPPRKKPLQESPTPKKPVAKYPATTPRPHDRWKLRLTRTGKILISALGISLGVLGSPLIFGLSVQNPIPVFPGQPFSIPFEITNQNVVPFKDISYSCNVNELSFAGGTRLANVQARPTGAYRATLYGLESMTARCEKAYVTSPDMKFVSAEIALAITYRPAMWPIRRTIVKTYSAIIDPHSGHIYRWVSK